MRLRDAVMDESVRGTADSAPLSCAAQSSLPGAPLVLPREAEKVNAIVWLRLLGERRSGPKRTLVQSKKAAG